MNVGTLLAQGSGNGVTINMLFRDETDYQQIGEHILYNPSKWEIDRENPNTNL